MKFKFSDKVRIINHNSLSFCQEGVIKDIETVGTFSNFPNYLIKFGTSTFKWFCESELELADDNKENN